MSYASLRVPLISRYDNKNTMKNKRIKQKKKNIQEVMEMYNRHEEMLIHSIIRGDRERERDYVLALL